MRRAIVSIGSNIEPRREYIGKALRALAGIPSTRLVRASGIIETDGVDVPAEYASMKFLNCAAILETSLPPLELLDALQAIETSLGRARTVRNGPRTIDLDIVDYDGIEMSHPRLVLPHPRARERDFVKIPVREIAKGNVPPCCL